MSPEDHRLLPPLFFFAKQLWNWHEIELKQKHTCINRYTSQHISRQLKERLCRNYDQSIQMTDTSDSCKYESMQRTFNTKQNKVNVEIKAIQQTQGCSSDVKLWGPNM